MMKQLNKNEPQKQSAGSIIINASQPIMQIGLSSISPILLFCDPGIGTFCLAVTGAASGAVSSIVPTVFDSIKQKRLELGIKKVNEHKIPLERFLISDKSISNLAKALECISNTARDEKIEYITNLVCNSALNDSIAEENDVFEMKLKLLDEVSYDEIDLLESLNKNFIPKPKSQGMQFDDVLAVLNKTKEGITIDTGIPNEFIPYRLDKLHGIGLCSKDLLMEFTFAERDAATNFYYPSPLYLDLRNYILEVHKDKQK